MIGFTLVPLFYKMKTITLQFDKCDECPFYDDGGRDGEPWCPKIMRRIYETQKTPDGPYEEWILDDCPLEDVKEG